MSMDLVIKLAQDTIYTVMIVIAPVMIASFVVGIIMSFLQAIFQIHEMSFSFVPKLIVIMASLILYAPWMLSKLSEFATRFFSGNLHLLQ